MTRVLILLLGDRNKLGRYGLEQRFPLGAKNTYLEVNNDFAPSVAKLENSKLVPLQKMLLKKWRQLTAKFDTCITEKKLM